MSNVSNSAELLCTRHRTWSGANTDWPYGTMPPSCPESTRRDRLYILMTILKYLAPKKENATKILDENSRNLVSPSSHSAPRNMLWSVCCWVGESDSDRNYEGSALGWRVETYSTINFANKVYICISMYLTTVSYFSIDSAFNRGRKGCYLLFSTKLNMIQVTVQQKYVQSIRIAYSVQSCILFEVWVCVCVYTPVQKWFTEV